MRLFRQLEDLPEAALGAAIAIGNFDGLHLGHRAVIQEMLAVAKARGLPSAVLTFAPHPKRFFNPGTPDLALEPFHVRARRLAAMGVELLFVAKFNAALSQMSAQAFVHDVLVGQLGAHHVTTGANFAFGFQRQGNADFLANISKQANFTYHAVKPYVYESLPSQPGQPYASSRVRVALQAGRLSDAAALLGRPYEMVGRVRHGEKRGHSLGYPTANLVPSGLLLPAFGVYAARYAMAEPFLPESPPSAWRPAVAYLGTRPTYGGTRPWLEVHGLDEAEPLYGRRLRVQLAEQVRGDLMFADDAELKAQIAKDITKTKQILEAWNA